MPYNLHCTFFKDINMTKSGINQKWKGNKNVLCHSEEAQCDEEGWGVVKGGDMVWHSCEPLNCSFLNINRKIIIVDIHLWVIFTAFQ